MEGRGGRGARFGGEIAVLDGEVVFLHGIGDMRRRWAGQALGAKRPRPKWDECPREGRGKETGVSKIMRMRKPTRRTSRAVPESLPF
jgi:hypothetical protein